MHQDRNKPAKNNCICSTALVNDVMLFTRPPPTRKTDALIIFLYFYHQYAMPYYNSVVARVTRLAKQQHPFGTNVANIHIHLK